MDSNSNIDKTICLDFLQRVLTETSKDVSLTQAIENNLPALSDAFGASAAILSPTDAADGPEYTLSFSLRGAAQTGKCLLLRFAQPPQLSAREEDTLRCLAEILGGLLIMGRAQNTTHSQATQSALLALAFRQLSEQNDLGSLLDKALEQAAMLINSATAHIWLLTADNHWLVASAAYWQRPGMPAGPFQRLPVDRQALEWAASLEKPAPLDLQAAPDWPFAENNQMWQENGRYLLATPLRYSGKLLGLITQQSDEAPYDQQDVFLMWEMAGPVASAVATSARMEELRRHSERQRSLYRMSRAITGSLEMEVVLKRAAVWAIRLCPAEYSLIWLVDESQRRLRLASAFGLPQPFYPAVLPVGQGVIGTAAAQGRIKSNNRKALPEAEQRWLQENLSVTARNLLAIPITYQDLSVGVLAIVNKTGGNFSVDDRALLTTGSQIIAAGISNAALYGRVLSLTEERERSRQQAVQSARLAAVGRLTASLAHEINNPMQAIKGAASLALEELDDPDALRDYLTLCLTETERVIQLIRRMRHIYAPDDRKPDTVDIGKTLEEATAVTRKELQRQKIRLRLKKAERPIIVWGYHHQLHLAFLNTMLTLGDVMGKRGGGDLYLRFGAAENSAYVAWTTAVTPVIASLQKILDGETSQETGFSLTLSRDIVAAHGGQMRLLTEEAGETVRLELPLHQDENKSL